MSKNFVNRVLAKMMHSKHPQTWILGFLFSFSNVLGVLFVTALPDLSQYFRITKGQAQETISYYLVGCILAQVIYPSLAKAFGRKPAIYIGGALTLLGALLCVIAIEMHSFSWLLCGRILTALGATCGPILTNTMLSDVYPPSEIKKKLSHLYSAFIVIPSLGIMVGGYITEYISWQGCFYFIFLYALFVIGLSVFLPETATEKHLSHLKIASIAKAYFHQLRNVSTILCALIIASASLLLYVFSAEAPFIARTQLHMSAASFGLYNLIPNVGFFLGGLVSAHLGHKLSARNFILVGACFFVLFSSIMCLLFEIGFVNTLVLFGMPFLIFFATPTILSNGQAYALSLSEDKPYTVSLNYMIMYFWMMMSITVLKFLPPQDPAILPALYTVSGALIILLWIVIGKLRKSRA